MSKFRKKPEGPSPVGEAIFRRVMEESGLAWPMTDHAWGLEFVRRLDAKLQMMRELDDITDEEFTAITARLKANTVARDWQWRLDAWRERHGIPESTEKIPLETLKRIENAAYVLAAKLQRKEREANPNTAFGAPEFLKCDECGCLAHGEGPCQRCPIDHPCA